MVFNFICEAISKVRTTIILDSPLELMPIRLSQTSVMRMYSILSRNIISLRKVSLGMNVYSGLPSGTFEYVQPAPVDQRHNLELEIKISKSLERLSRLYKTNLNLVIYASIFSKEISGISGVKNEFVVNPPYYESYENDLSMKKEIVLTISRIHPSKRLDIVGEMSRKVRAKFVIIGYLEKSMENYLQYLRKNYPDLEIIPNASEEVKRNLLYLSKVYLHAGVGEAFSISKVEAMNAGCVPLVPLYGGAKEGIPPSLIYSTPDDLLSKLEYNLSNYNKTTGIEMIEASRKYNLENFKNHISYYVDNYLD